MNFAFAAYLAGLAFLSVPIILHLLRLRPTTIKVFPSFYLLTRKIAKRQQRNNLLKYLILLCRCAALAFFCLAFAWPYFADIDLEPESAEVIIRDISFSTDTRHAQAAIQKALQQELSTVSAKTPVLGAAVADTIRWSGEFTADRKALDAFFSLNESAQTTSNFLQALYQADSRLGTISAARKRITVITDHQALPWRRLPTHQFLKHADEIRIRPAASPAPRRNTAITSATVDTQYTLPKLELDLNVKLANFNAEETTCVLKVFLDDKLQQTREIVLLPRSEKSEQFKLKTPTAEPAPLSGKVVLETVKDELELDNTRYFAVNPFKAPDIYLTRAAEFDFIREALHGGSSIIQDGKLPENAPLLIISDDAGLESDAAAQLDTALENGTSVIIVYRNTRTMKSLLDRFGIGVAADPVKQTEFEMINFEHPVFREYLEVSAGSWFDISFFEVPVLQVPPGARIIASFSGGHPAVVEMNRGRGKLIVLAASIDRAHTNFQTYGAFLPFWRELVLYCADNSREPDSFLTASQPLMLPGGELKRDRAGVFKVGDKLYSVNVDTRESDLAPLPEPFNGAAWIAPKTAEEKPEIKLARLDQAKDYKSLLLILMLIFAMTELLLSNRTVN